MSGRIRTIKPELLEDAITAGLSDMAFRLFVACILLADDYGNLRFEAGWLKGQVYWARPVDDGSFADAIVELTVAPEGQSEPLILPYMVKGQRYAAIRGWSKHQRVQKPGKPRVPAAPESSTTLSGESPETLRPDLRSPIVEDDHQSESTREEPLESTHTLGVASLGGETLPVAGLEASLDTPIPDAWRARAVAIVHRTSVDFDVPGTWRKYVASCMDGRRRLTEPGWVLWAENECRFTASRQARRDDTAWGKVRPAVAEPGAPPYCAAAKPPCTPDYDRDTAVSTAAALAAGNFGPATRKAGGA